MAVRVDDEALGTMRANSGAIHLVVISAVDDARVGLEEALRRIFEIPHPEEPDEPLASWAGPVEPVDDGWGLLLDLADAEAYEGILEAVLDVVVQALERTGVLDALVVVRRSAPPAPATAAAASTHPLRRETDERAPSRSHSQELPVVAPRTAVDWVAGCASRSALGRVGLTLDEFPSLISGFNLTAVMHPLAGAVTTLLDRLRDEAGDQRMSSVAETAACEQLERTVEEAARAAAEWHEVAYLRVLAWRSMTPVRAVTPLGQFVLMSTAAEIAAHEWVSTWQRAGVAVPSAEESPMLGLALAPFLLGQPGSPLTAASAAAAVPEISDVDEATRSAIDDRLREALPARVEPLARAVVAALSHAAIQFAFTFLAPADKIALADELSSSYAQLGSEAC
jgi:hypothetical protein